MNIAGKRILLTGASGGIGSQIALKMAGRGAELVLADRQSESLEQLQWDISAQGGKAHILVCDFSETNAVEALVQRSIETMGGVDVLVNCAGVSSFIPFADQPADAIDKLWRINVIAPMQLSRALLPQMLARRGGRIVNIGSIFGSIGFAYFTAYSASKFAIRGFSEALRRELEGSGVGVTYVAPRFTRTPLNEGAVDRMAKAVGMNSDDPAVVAQLVVRAIEKDKQDCYIGWPESLFVRINALLPRIVDSALRKQNAQMREFVDAESH